MPTEPTDTRTRIIDAFAAHYGPHGSADLEVVAEAAGVSRSTIYRHFADATAILEAARQEGLAAGAKLVERHLAPALRGDPGSDVLTGATELVAAVLEDGVPYASLLRHDAGATDVIAERFAALATEVIRRAQRSGTVDAHLDPHAVFVAALAICQTLIVQVQTAGLPATAARPVVDRFFASLRPA